MSALSAQTCVAQRGAAMAAPEVAQWMVRLEGWTLRGNGIEKRLAFADFHATMAFVNAVASIAHEQDHHPELQVSYGHCTVRWSTHSVGGLSICDFICAAKIDAMSL